MNLRAVAGRQVDTKLPGIAAAELLDQFRRWDRTLHILQKMKKMDFSISADEAHFPKVRIALVSNSQRSENGKGVQQS